MIATRASNNWKKLVNTTGKLNTKSYNEYEKRYCITWHGIKSRHMILCRESSFEGLLQLADKYVAKKSTRANQRNAYQITEDVWERRSADDMVFLINVMVDVFVKPIKSVQAVTSTDETSIDQLGQMIR